MCTIVWLRDLRKGWSVSSWLVVLLPYVAVFKLKVPCGVSGIVELLFIVLNRLLYCLWVCPGVTAFWGLLSRYRGGLSNTVGLVVALCGAAIWP